ncbi:MAG: hypothetical protein M3065_15525 [Actinomycetota bacterium]|nr:hypothetical protein [Actinomycetota bacterium]
MRLRAGLPAVVFAVVIAFATLPAPAGARLLAGISDENGAVFSNPYFKDLGVKSARYITNYDAALKNPTQTDSWMAAARADGAQIIVAFNPGYGTHCPSSPCTLPSASQYAKAFIAFHMHYPYVKIYQPWNEVNSTTQPTWTEPQAVVTYYSIVKKYCKGCTVLGADIEDLVTPHKANYIVFIKALLAAFKKAHIATPQVWGIHNYEDVNYSHATNTVKMLALLPGEIWLTETGGIAFFETSGLRVLLPYDLVRQKNATNWMMTLALRYPKRIARLYIYNFLDGAAPPGPTNRFDSALVGPDGMPRLAWYALLAHDKKYFG